MHQLPRGQYRLQLSLEDTTHNLTPFSIEYADQLVKFHKPSEVVKFLTSRVVQAKVNLTVGLQFYDFHRQSWVALDTVGVLTSLENCNGQVLVEFDKRVWSFVVLSWLAYRVTAIGNGTERFLEEQYKGIGRLVPARILTAATKS